MEYIPPILTDEQRDAVFYQTTESYKHSFPDISPYNNENHPHSATKYAESGFRFVGKSSQDDRVYCPYCRVDLHDWDHSEHTIEMPLEEHKKTEHIVGRPCWFLRELIFRGKRPWQQMGQHPQYETLSPEMDANRHPNYNKADELEEFFKDRPQQTFGLNDLKRIFAEKIMAPCNTCLNAEKVTAKECLHVNCAKYHECNGGKCAVCFLDIDDQGAVPLKLQSSSTMKLTES